MNSFTESLSGPALWLWWGIVGFGFLGSVLFPVLYHIGSKGTWRHTEMGRHLMAFSAAVSLALLALLLRIAFGDYPGRQLVSFGAMISLVFVVWWRSLLYMKIRRKPKERGRHELV